MSPQGGPSSWDFPFLRAFADDRNFYLGGRFYLGQLPEGVKREPSGGANVVATHAKTHQVQIPYTGVGRPDQRRAFKFTLEWQADDQDDYFYLLARGVSAEIMDFCCFWWLVDRFSPVADGTTYQLSRRRATEMSLSGVDETGFPTAWICDGVDKGEGDMAAETAQTFSTTAPYDEVIVRYLPLCKVVVSGISEVANSHNDLVLSLELTEVLEEA